MDEAASIIQKSLKRFQQKLQPGWTTAKAVDFISQVLLEEGAEGGFFVQISPEEVAWHGQGGARVLQNGELVTADVACHVGGFWADMACTFPIGLVNQKRLNLLEAAQRGTLAALGALGVGTKGKRVFEVLQGICEHYSVALIREGAGHGIGRRLHQSPSLTYDGRLHEELLGQHFYTVEPVFSAGNSDLLWNEDGSVQTLDASPTAHFEITIVLEDHGPRVLGGWPFFFS
ncbi:MAG: methionyl aminopeptidase [Spirochaetales bacterium]|nr:methionyl aminopeptidase [Spirochaetales bacterium]